MVHHVDVNLPWNHSLCACCLSRILHPATPTTYQIATPNALRLHLQQPVHESIKPCPASHNRPSQAILAYSATVRVQGVWGTMGPGVGRGGSGRTALAAAAARRGGVGGGGGLSRVGISAGSPAEQFKWKADIAPMPAAEGMFLEWMAEPRVGLLLDLDVVRCQLADMMKIHDLVAASGGVTAAGATTAAATAARATTSRASSAVVATASGATAGGGAPKHFWWCCWQCSACWTAYRRCLSVVVFLVLVARLPRIVTIWRLHMKSCYVAFPALANQLNAGRQIGGVGGRQAERQASRQAGKGGGRQAGGEAEEDCFGSILAHGGMRAGMGRGGGVGGGIGWVEGGEEWREGLRGMEWDVYVERVGEIISQGGLEAEQYSGMVITGVDPTDFALRAALTLCVPLAAVYGMQAFTGACSNRYKERVEGAAVEAARQRLAERLAERAERLAERAEESGQGSVVEGGVAVNTEKKVEDQAAASSAARLVPVISDPAVALFTYRAACLLQWVRVHGPRLNPPSYCTRTNPEAPVLALPHPVHDLPSLLVRFGAIPKPAGTAGSEGSAVQEFGVGGGVPGWEEFPVGDREALKAHSSGSALGGRERVEGIGGVEEVTAGLATGEFLGLNTFQTGSFRDSVFDRDEMLKEFNVGAAKSLQERGIATSPVEDMQEYRAARALSDSSMVTPAFPTLADRVEEFLRRFSPKRQAKEGRGGPLARAITDWVLRLHLTAAAAETTNSSSSSSSSSSRGAEGERRDMSFAALALGAYSPAKLKPMLRSAQEVDAFLEFMAAMTTLTPACTGCSLCLNVFNRAVTPAAVVASFAFRPSSVLLRCILSLYPQRFTPMKELLDTLGIPPLPDLVPNRLVAPLLEGVLEHKRLHFLYTAAILLSREGVVQDIMELHRADGVVRSEEEFREVEWNGWERGEEWLMWEEVDSWRNAVLRAWPVTEMYEAPHSWAATGVEERVRECCAGMRLREREYEEICRGKEWDLVDRMVAAAAAGAAAAAAAAASEAESEVGGGLKIAPACLVPWVGGVNPFACLREMLLGETCYWELSDGRRVGVTPGAGAGAGEAGGAVAAGGVRCCAFPECGRAEGPGRPPLKACSRKAWSAPSPPPPFSPFTPPSHHRSQRRPMISFSFVLIALRLFRPNAFPPLLLPESLSPPLSPLLALCSRVPPPVQFLEWAAFYFLAWAASHGLYLSPKTRIKLTPDVPPEPLESATDSPATKTKTTSGSSSSGGGAGGGGKGGSKKGEKGGKGGKGESGGSGMVRLVRGLVAEADMESGDTLCKIPMSLALWFNTSQDGDAEGTRGGVAVVGGAGGAKGGGSMRERMREMRQRVLQGRAAAKASIGGGGRKQLGWDLVALRILEEKAKGDASPWAPYIRSLPPSVPLPIFLPPEEEGEVQWASTMEQVKRMNEEIRETYHKHHDSTHPTLSFDEYKWAVSMVHSRAFTLPVRPGGKFEQFVMMPFMDAINHHYNNHMDWMAKPVSSEGVLEIRLKRAAKKGEQLFTSFGPRSNENLFLYYGEWGRQEGRAALHILWAPQQREPLSLLWLHFYHPPSPHHAQAGFILDGNPFDSLALFPSFEDSVRWLLDRVYTDCRSDSLQRHMTVAAIAGASSSAASSAVASAAVSSCSRISFTQAWKQARAALDRPSSHDASRGFERDRNLWWDLMNSWASFGYEILPYRAGPDVRPAGRIDPSLLAALAAAARFAASAPNRTLPAGAFPRCPPGWRKDGKSGGGWGRVGGAGEGKGGLSWPRCCRTKAWRIACRSDGVGGNVGSTESTGSTGNEVDDELGDDGEVQTGGVSGISTGSTDGEDAAKAALRAAKAAEDEAAVAAAEYVKLLIVRRCRELMIGMATPAHYDWWLLQDVDRVGGKLLGSDGGVDGTGAKRIGVVAATVACCQVSAQ
ncbi:unnamed protein product [Closterium sp. Naga37s-1]|nr:unnamed protein product [Closterium sp. Naga37s-1]